MTDPLFHIRAIAGEVEVVVGGVQDVEALAVGLHDPVLDAVVDHLRVVAGAGRHRSRGSRSRGPASSPPARSDRRPRACRRPWRRSRPARPHTPPDTPMSSHSSPRSASSAAWRLESWKRLLPASMITSPGSRIAASWSISASVASPDGTLITTWRGGRHELHAAARSARRRRSGPRSPARPRPRPSPTRSGSRPRRRGRRAPRGAPSRRPSSPVR